MNSINVNIREIKSDRWMQELDGLWYTHIPFECDDNDDIIINLVDPEEYINQHKNDFDSLGNGYTKKNTCIITASKKPSCNITVELVKAEMVPGRVIYTKDANGNFVAEFEPDKNMQNMFELKS